MNYLTGKPQLILSCEHGGNQIPDEWRFCFQGAAEALESHRGYDIGALPIARHLAVLLDLPLHFATISRLLVDLNRSPAHPHRFSEWTRPLEPQQRQQIEADYYLPYREQVVSAIRSKLDAAEPVVHLSIHSFTPILNGTERNAEIGLLYDPKRKREKDFCQQLHNHLQLHWPDHGGSPLRIRRNYPYSGIQDGFIPWLRKQFNSTEYLGVELEFNQGFLSQHDAQPNFCATSLAEFLQHFLKQWEAAG